MRKVIEDLQEIYSYQKAVESKFQILVAMQHIN